MAATTIEQLQNQKYLTLQTLKNSTLWDSLYPYTIALGISNPRQLLFHASNNLSAIPVCDCGKALDWHSDLRKYRSFCSKKCTAIGTKEQVKNTNLGKYGVTHYSKTKEYADKVKNTSLKQFGVSHYSKSDEFLNRVTETNLKKYGVPFASQSPTIKEKTKNYFIKQFGVDNPMQLPEVQNKLFNNNMQTIGVGNVAQRHYSPEIVRLLSNDDEFTTLCNIISIREIAQMYNISVNPLYTKVQQLGIVLPQFNQSLLEKEIIAFIKEKYSGQIVCKDRSILGNREIDVWLPELGIAIEANGSYWHSENNGRTKNYHLEKTKSCNKKGIRLLHIWEHHWFQKKDIVKSMLLSVLGGSQKIFARKCKVVCINSQTANGFLNKNHLQGAAIGSICYGLLHHNELVSVMTFCKTRFSKVYQWELLRFANKINYNVVGGGSKLFAQFLKDHCPNSVVSYCDISIHSGNVYNKLGFVLTHHSAPNYRYTNDYQIFHSRNKFQKHLLEKKLTNYDKNLSEWENMRSNGWDRIWDCGNQVFVWNSN